jgi:hypothetical protein
MGLLLVLFGSATGIFGAIIRLWKGSKCGALAVAAHKPTISQ